MRNASAYVKTVKMELGYGGLKAPEKPVPVWCPGAATPTPMLPMHVKRQRESASMPPLV